MGNPFIRAHCTFRIAAAICAFWVTSACCQEAAKQPKVNSEVERCRRINNELFDPRPDEHQRFKLPDSLFESKS